MQWHFMFKHKVCSFGFDSRQVPSTSVLWALLQNFNWNKIQYESIRNRIKRGNYSFSTSVINFKRDIRRNAISILKLLDHPQLFTSGTSSLGDTDIVVNGYVQSFQTLKRVGFAKIGDGSCLRSLQVVLQPEQSKLLSNGVAVQIIGELKTSTGSEQDYELHAKHLSLLGENNVLDYPMQNKYQSREFLRGYPHLRLRLPQFTVLLQFRSFLIGSISSFFAQHDFVQTHPPLITRSDCEGAGEVFSLKTQGINAGETDLHVNSTNDAYFFRDPAYLTVSTQLHLEALAQALNKVWTLSPNFRADRSDTPRHLSEFYMLEAEMSFIERLDDVMQVVEDLIKFVVKSTKESRIASDLLARLEIIYRGIDRKDNSSANRYTLRPEDLRKRWDNILMLSWPRVTYNECISILTQASEHGHPFSITPSYEEGLSVEHERYIVLEVGKGAPVFIMDYPRHQKPFYMRSSHSTLSKPGILRDEKYLSSLSSTVDCFDLIVPDMYELAGGSMREQNMGELQKFMQAKEMTHHNGEDMYCDHMVVGANVERRPLKNDVLDWYLDLRRYGSVPHGGFGIGFDRLLGFLAGEGNLRDIVAFPRHAGRCQC